MKILELNDEQIIEKWKRYCRRNRLAYKEPNLPLNRGDEYVNLETEKGKLATFCFNTFCVNDTLMKTTDQRIEEIACLLEKALELLEVLYDDNRENKSLEFNLGEIVIRTAHALEAVGLIRSSALCTDTF